MKRARTDVTGSSLETEGSVNETASIHLRSLPLAIVHKSRAACRIRGSGRTTRARTARLTSTAFVSNQIHQFRPSIHVA
jgi:hypothetical protein